jgi:pilus assembly protein Flp/PilA
MLKSFFAKEEGQGLVEYALILVLIAIVVIGILTVLGNQVSNVFSQINSGLEGSN